MTSPPFRPATQRRTVAVLGTLQILAWGTSFYLPAVLAQSIAQDTGWPYEAIVGGLSIGLFVAGIVSPRMGRAIGRYGGRGVLAFGAVLFALGLMLIGAAPELGWYLVGWSVLGIGMGTGLYDAAFATLGGIYGKDARGPITGVTLFGGFASTVCWPISAFLVEHAGWRGTCFAYAAAFLLIALPLYLLTLPRIARPTADTPAPAKANRPAKAGEPALFVVLASVLTISAAILAMMGAHLVALLQAGGLTLAQAVALGMLIGPSAVGARFVEMLFGHRYHPIWTMTASAVLVAAGMGLFLVSAALFAPAIILYASGNGIGSIAKGTLPLALFGAARYPVLMGRLALPIMFAMSLSPYGAAFVFTHGGAAWTFRAILVMALVNIALVILLWLLRGRTAGSDV